MVSERRKLSDTERGIEHEEVLHHARESARVEIGAPLRATDIELTRHGRHKRHGPIRDHDIVPVHGRCAARLVNDGHVHPRVVSKAHAVVWNVDRAAKRRAAKCKVPHREAAAQVGVPERVAIKG